MAAEAAPDSRRTYRRRTYLLDPRFQLKYTLIIALIGGGISAILGLFVYRAHRDNTELLEVSAALSAEVQKSDQSILLYLLLFIGTMMVALAVFGVIVTHRMAGPMMLIQRYLRVLADGRYPDIRPLRKRDELREFFGAFSTTVDAMRERERKELEEIEQAIAQSKNDPEHALKTLMHIHAQLASTVSPGGAGVHVEEE